VLVVLLLLILLVLLHSGRGDASPTCSEGMGAPAAGTMVMERNLGLITVVIAVLSGYTTVILALRLQFRAALPIPGARSISCVLIAIAASSLASAFS
jgi:preprotein translocase subunit SecG